VQRIFSRIFGSAVAWSFVATGLRFGSALFLLPLILRRVPPEQLGLWYVFLSFGALAGLVDFGFAPTISRVTAYLWAGARELRPYGLTTESQGQQSQRSQDSTPNLVLLSRLIGALRFYYFVLGMGALILLIAAGGSWIEFKTRTLPNANSVRIAFAIYSVGVALNLVGSVWIYVLNGVNRVRESLQINALCLLENYVIAAMGLLAGLQLWALVLATFAMGVTERVLGAVMFRKFVPLEKSTLDLHMIRLLWPNAWRTGAVVVGMFMVLQANTLICSGFLGLKVTASYGLSLQAVNLLVAVSSVWVVVKLPLINQLRAQGRLEELVMIFRTRILLSILTYMSGASLLLLCGHPMLGILHAKTQLLPLPLLAAMLIIYLIEAHGSLYASLVYSENVNPFVLPVLISGSAIVLLSILLAPRIGVWGMLASQAIVQLCCNNWWPVVRAIRGLGIGANKYWSDFFNWRHSLYRARLSIYDRVRQ
jgi:O-antigen/teichoic acid export membrane protein